MQKKPLPRHSIPHLRETGFSLLILHGQDVYFTTEKAADLSKDSKRSLIKALAISAKPIKRIPAQRKSMLRSQQITMLLPTVMISITAIKPQLIIIFADTALRMLLNMR